nr:LPS export ABC transporter ATP-binding protein [Synergistaceae bacterium]
KRFGQRTVVKQVSIKVSSGEVVGLLGPNGAGKSTTFSILLGLITPNNAKIFLNDLDITRAPIYQRARLGISFLPQEPSIFSKLSVRDNLQAVVQMNKNTGEHPVIDPLLEDMGLIDIANVRAGLLSGGERRRLEIARALLFKPAFLLLDEPFAGIDPIQINEIQAVITAVSKKGIGIMITDHNVRDLLKITNRSYIINKGEVIFNGASRELMQNERVKREYLGSEFRWH